MILNIILITLFIPVVLLNIIGPLIIYRTQKLPTRVHFQTLNEQEFPAKHGDDAARLGKKLQALGFEHIGSSSLPDTHNTAYFSLYSHAKDYTTAMLVTMDNKAKSFTYIEFSQLYSDGTMLDVSNAPVVPVYPRMSLKLSTRYPAIHDAEDLYGIFLKLKSILKNSSSPAYYKPEYGFSKVEEFMAWESDKLVELGYCKNAIDSDGKRALTLKGAFILTWKSVFPGKYIYDKVDQSYSKKILNNN